MTRPRARPALPEIVVIGGSAGAFDAAIHLLSEAPNLTPPAVLVLHLARHRPSQLASVLASSLGRPVTEAEDKMPLAPKGIYVAPPDYHLLIDAGPALALSVDLPLHYSLPSIDVLFESAADVLGPHVVAVLLSGANDDGARGMGAVLAAGGRAMVQSPEEATSAEMPLAALRLNPGLMSLGVREIAERLRTYEEAL